MLQTSFETTQTRLIGSVFSAYLKPDEKKENPASMGIDHTGIMSETEGRNPSASNPPHFLAPAQEIQTCGGHTFELSEIQVTKGSILQKRTRSLPPNQGVQGQTGNKRTGTSQVDHIRHRNDYWQTDRQTECNL